MKNIFRFISLLLFLIIVFFIVFNISNTITLETPFLSLKANVGFLIFFCVTISSLATLLLLISWERQSKYDKSKINEQMENTNLTYEIEAQRVKQLEAKIDSLEEALRKIIKK